MKKIAFVILFVFVVLGTDIPLSAIAVVLPEITSGNFVIQPESHGELWYINPSNFHRYYLNDETSAVDILNELDYVNLQNIFHLSNYNNIESNNIKLLGISNANINKIPIGLDIKEDPATDLIKKDDFKYFGWWGKINENLVPVMAEPSASSTRIGYFGKINQIKIIKNIINENNKIEWYKIDGGTFPGAYIFSKYVDPISQPTAPENFIVPDNVQQADYWIDVDIGKKILTLFKYDKPVFITYVAVGRTSNPTLPGTYSIWSKFKKGTMTGGPPIVPYVYNLKDVPWIMYYRGSYALHGTYWHDEFGSQKSAGCTNLTQGDAKHIFEIVSPKTVEGSNFTRSSQAMPGTIVYNHY